MVIPRPPAEVWPHLTQPAQMVRWWRGLLSLSRPLDSAPGTPLAFLLRRPDGATDALVGTVLEVEAPTLVRWSHRSDRFESTGAYRLLPCAEGTRLVHELEVRPRYRIAARLAGAAQTALSTFHAADLLRLRDRLAGTN
ncbi:MAG: Polyketide cyclase / dehydrase and lipid transport [Thermoplasmata archaeon]|jgi:uncharacterized protein YndB with AHSA1/START domain|nr:Polyketide cyclase / dehydrase and lipid transport [Thermoplasmata archaeon]